MGGKVQSGPSDEVKDKMRGHNWDDGRISIDRNLSAVSTNHNNIC